MNPLPDFRTLRAFVMLAREGSYTRAAQRLNLTQSAISHAMRVLQEDLGCCLLYKSGRRIILTNQGRALFQSAERILNEVEQIPDQLRSIDGQGRGQLKLGCSASGARFILPPVLREFKECFSGYDIAVQLGSTAALTALLAASQMDLAIGVRPEESQAFKVASLFSDDLYFLVSPQHAWGAMKAAPVKQYKNQTFIVPGRGSMTFEKIEQHFLYHGVRLSSLIEVGSVEAINELVKIGLGVGIGARWTVRDELQSGAIRALPMRPRIRREWVVMWLKERPLNLAEETFVGLCESAGSNLATLDFPPHVEKTERT